MSSAKETNRSYRRGAIMGLTMAEVFILIAFALLLLFFFLQRQMNAEEMKAFRNLPEEMRIAVVEAIPDDSLEAFLILRERCINIPIYDEQDKIEEHSPLTEQDGVIRIVDEAFSLPPGQQNDIRLILESENESGIGGQNATVDEYELEGYDIDNILEWFVESQLCVEEFAETAELKKELDRKEITISELQETADALKEQEKEEQFRNEIADKIRKAAEQQEELVATLQRELGSLVEQVGGRIDPTTGEVIFLGVLFEQGKSSITQERREFLNEFCEPWLNLLRLSSVDIYEVKIEGHASSEWNPESDELEAYLGNLDLSQRRSQAVLRECMYLVNDADLLEWARGHMIAVGYSSARTVSQNGEEDRIASRRVVFSATPNRESLIEEIETEANKYPNDG